MAAFQVGDVVRLKSGGPAMTVTKTGFGADMVLCEWFEEGDAKQKSFPTASLIRIEERK
jgi:uncharacterized protein YodC (DUF2158 family)